MGIVANHIEGLWNILQWIARLKFCLTLSIPLLKSAISNQPHAVYSVTVVCDFKSVVVPAKCRHFDSDSYHRFCPVLHSSRYDPMAPGRYTGASPLLRVLLGRQQWQLRFSAVHEPCSEHYKVLVLGQPFHVLRAAESWDWTTEVHWRTPSGKRK